MRVCACFSFCWLPPSALFAPPRLHYHTTAPRAGAVTHHVTGVAAKLGQRAAGCARFAFPDRHRTVQGSVSGSVNTVITVIVLLLLLLPAVEMGRCVLRMVQMVMVMLLLLQLVRYERQFHGRRTVRTVRGGAAPVTDAAGQARGRTAQQGTIFRADARAVLRPVLLQIGQRSCDRRIFGVIFWYRFLSERDGGYRDREHCMEGI